MEIKVVGITGGSGFLGSALARRLAGQYEVRLFDREPPADLDLPGIRFTRCDVTSKTDCLAALEGVDAVFHRVGLMGNLASMKAPHAYYSVNFLGTLNVLDACVARGVKRFIFDSTEAVYGHAADGPIKESLMPVPNSIYGATKLACEAAIRMYEDKHGLSTLVFRYCRTRNRHKHDAITILAKKVLKGEPVTLYDGGEPVIDFVELDDLVAANAAALTAPIRREVLNIASGEGVSFAGLLTMIERVAGRRAGAVTFEAVPASPPMSEHKFGTPRFYLDIEKAKRHLAWAPTSTTESSIAGTIAALRSQP